MGFLILTRRSDGPDEKCDKDESRRDDDDANVSSTRLHFHVCQMALPRSRKNKPGRQQPNKKVVCRPVGGGFLYFSDDEIFVGVFFFVWRLCKTHREEKVLNRSSFRCVCPNDPPWIPPWLAFKEKSKIGKNYVFLFLK